MKTVLITGGEGFLGSHLADFLAKRGDRVIIIDHHQKEKKRYLPKSVEVHHMDFSDERVREILLETKLDCVFHLAAQISVTKSMAFPLQDAEKNILAPLRFLGWCKDAKVGKIVFASSGGAIYGDYPVRPTPLVFDVQPLSPYGIGKQAFEQYLESAGTIDRLPWAAMRFSNLYGPRQQVTKPLGEGNVISLFLDKMLVTGEPFIVYGDGSASRDYLFIDDAVDALVRAWECPFSGVVNVGSEKETSLRTLLDNLFTIHGSDHSIVYLPGRPGEVAHSVLNASSAREHLGWNARTDFHEGLQKTYDWYAATFAR